MKWRLYYDDGSTFSDLEGEPWESPLWGVIGVIQPPVRHRTAGGIVGKNGDYLLYRQDLGLWHLIGASGLQDHLAHFAHLITCVRVTRWMPEDKEFGALWERMREDADVQI